MKPKKFVTPNGFWLWLSTQLDKRGWRDVDLAKAADISHSVISKARSGIQPIGYDACKAIAQALNVPERLVLEKAGHLTPDPQEEAPTFLQMLHLLRQLTDDELESEYDALSARLERKKQREKASRPANKAIHRAGG